MSLNPEAQKFLELWSSHNAPKITDIGVAARYLGYAEPDLAGPLEEGVRISHRFISSNSADLPIRIYTPTGVGPFNGFVYFHGGGWVFGRIDQYDSQMTYLAKATNSVIVSVNYQKSPEHKFPTPHQDCYETLEWVAANASELKIDASKIGVGGDSAGGNLASGVSLRARDEGKFDIAYQLLLYPAVDLNFKTKSYDLYAEGYGLTKEEMMWFWNQYLNPEDHENPYAVPARAKDFSKLPPAIIIIAEYDVLRDDGLMYVKKLSEAGNVVISKNFESEIHGFFSHGKYVKSAFGLREFIAKSINEIVGKS